MRGAWVVSVLAAGCLTQPNPDWMQMASGTGSATGGAVTTSGESSGGNDASESATSQGATTDVVTGGPAQWWDGAWRRRREIVLDTQAPGEALSAFPVLVQVPPEVFDAAQFGPDGQGVRFIDGGDELPYEVESLQGSALYWVSIPQIEAGAASQSIYMYYDNPQAAAGADPSGVWSTGEVGVYHLSDEQDAAGQAGAGTILVAQHDQGLVGSGLRFQGDEAESMSLAPGGGLDGLFADGGTISVLLRLTSFGGGTQGRIIEKAQNHYADNGWIFNVDDYDNFEGQQNTQTVRFVRGYSGKSPVGAVWEAPTGAITVSTWHFVGVTYDEEDSPPAFFIDGQQVVTSGDPAPGGSIEPETSGPALVGSSVAEGRSFDGIIDELWLSSVIRSPAWFALQNRSLRDELVTIGDEEVY